MSTIQHGKTLAEKFIALHVNLMCWSRNHFDHTFSVNGKGEEEMLTMPQFALLVHIRDLALNTVSDIANSLHLSKSSASLNISKLVLKGYLRKEQPASDDDGRKSYFYLTEKGHAAMHRTEELVVETVGAYFRSLDPNIQEEVCVHLDALNELLITGGSGE